MLFIETKLLVSDNSGGKLVKCIRVLGKNHAQLGSLILVVLRKKSAKSTLTKKKVYYGLVIQLAYPAYRLDGKYIVFHKNTILLLSDKLKFLGTRILTPLVKELVDLRFKSLLIKSRLLL